MNCLPFIYMLVQRKCNWFKYYLKKKIDWKKMNVIYYRMSGDKWLASSLDDYRVYSFSWCRIFWIDFWMEWNKPVWTGVLQCFVSIY